MSAMLKLMASPLFLQLIGLERPRIERPLSKGHRADQVLIVMNIHQRCSQKVAQAQVFVTLVLAIIVELALAWGRNVDRCQKEQE